MLVMRRVIKNMLERWPRIRLRAAAAAGAKALLPALVMAALVLAWPARCPAQQASEYDIKAVYLYNFLLFISWPDTDSQDIVIGIVGHDLFGKAFEKVEGSFVTGSRKRLLIKRFGRYRDQEDLSACHILFISRSEKENFETITGAVKNRPVLTVGDSPEFLARGGMINFVVINEKVRWELSRMRIKAAGLKLPAQLLQSAVKVEP